MTRIIDIECALVVETPNAVLAESVTTGEQGWLPKSQIETDREEGKDTVVVTLPEWLAQEKGFV